jgi:hypothetical protein
MIGNFDILECSKDNRAGRVVECALAQEWNIVEEVNLI